MFSLQKIIYGSFRQGIATWKCKKKSFRQIQLYSDIFRHIHARSCVIRHIEELLKRIQAYSEPCVTLAYLERQIFRTLAYSEPWYIQNKEYLEPWQTSSMDHFAKKVSRYNYFRNINFSRSLLCEKKNLFNTRLIFTPEVPIRSNKVSDLRGPGVVNFLYVYLLMYSNKLAYLQLIPILVYGSTPLKKVMNRVKHLAKSLKITSR